MGPPSYFVKIRKRTITILPPIKPNPLPHTLTPFPWQTDTELRNTWSCRSTQMDLHNVQEQMCSIFSTFRNHHVSSRTCQRPTWQWTAPTLLQLIWNAISHLSTSMNSRSNGGKEYQVPISPRENELLHHGDYNTDDTITILPFFNGKPSSPYYRKAEY